MKVKLIIKVHSDKTIKYPQGYFNATVMGLKEFWTMTEVKGKRMVIESVTRELGWAHSPQEVFSNIVPELYESSSMEVISVD